MNDSPSLTREQCERVLRAASFPVAAKVRGGLIGYPRMRSDPARAGDEQDLELAIRDVYDLAGVLDRYGLGRTADSGRTAAAERIAHAASELLQALHDTKAADVLSDLAPGLEVDLGAVEALVYDLYRNVDLKVTMTRRSRDRRRHRYRAGGFLTKERALEIARLCDADLARGFIYEGDSLSAEQLRALGERKARALAFAEGPAVNEMTALEAFVRLELMPTYQAIFGRRPGGQVGGPFNRFAQTFFAEVGVHGRDGEPVKAGTISRAMRTHTDPKRRRRRATTAQRAKSP